MRITQITLRNFRGVADVTVEFSDGVTVVTGPNEVGKSSIAEAFRTIRKVKSSSTAAAVKALKPQGSDVAPEVELHLSTGQYRLVYSKRWLKKERTELRVLAPAPEQHTADAAQVRFDAILRETVDLSLLDALEVKQGESLSQALLDGVGALTRALDASAVHQDASDVLIDKVQAAYAEFFTGAARKPTGKYGAAIRELAELTAELEMLESQAAGMDVAVRRVAVLESDVAALEKQLATQKSDLKLLRVQDADLTDARTDVETYTRELADAERALADAVRLRSARESLIEEARRRESAVTAQQEIVAHLAVRRDTAADAHRDARAAEEAARKDADEAREAAEAAQAALDRRHDLDALAALETRVGRARKAAASLTAARAAIANLPVTRDALHTLEGRYSDLRVAESARASAAAQVVVRSLGEPAVEVGGAAIAVGAEVTRSVIDTLSVVVPDVVEVEVRPAVMPADLEQAERKARDAYRAQLAAVGVSCVDEAREGAQARDAAEADLDRSQRAEEAALDGKTLAELELALASLRDRVERRGDADADTALEITDLQEALEEARSLQRETADAYRAAGESLTARADAATQADGAHATAKATLEHLTVESEDAARQLAAARELDGDAPLADRTVDAQLAVEAARKRKDDADAVLAAKDAAGVALVLENAIEVVDNTTKRIEAKRNDLAAARGKVEALADQGIYDKTERVRAQREEVDRTHERLDRDARAVKLLRNTLIRHRDAARKAYQLPFRRAVEELGRRVLGPSFSVELDDTLAIKARTLHGITVDFTMLSAGAREQLALISRLACARLVDPADGAPVILDDTLGFSDPERLTRLNAVINEVGKTAQIIVLTCQPERFAQIGNATHVEMKRD